MKRMEKWFSAVHLSPTIILNVILFWFHLMIHSMESGKKIVLTLLGLPCAHSASWVSNNIYKLLEKKWCNNLKYISHCIQDHENKWTKLLPSLTTLTFMDQLKMKQDHYGQRADLLGGCMYHLHQTVENFSHIHRNLLKTNALNPTRASSVSKLVRKSSHDYISHTFLLYPILNLFTFSFTSIQHKSVLI